MNESRDYRPQIPKGQRLFLTCTPIMMGDPGPSKVTLIWKQGWVTQEKIEGKKNHIIRYGSLEGTRSELKRNKSIIPNCSPF